MWSRDSKITSKERVRTISIRCLPIGRKEEKNFVGVIAVRRFFFIQLSIPAVATADLAGEYGFRGVPDNI